MTGSTSAATATTKSTTPGHRRNASSGSGTGSNGKEWGGGDPFDPENEDWDDNEDDEDWDNDEDGPQNGEFAPDHDIS